MPITAFYASILAALFVILALRVIAVRRSARVALGDGGDRLLLRRIRVHANFAEYAPMGLVLIGLAESVKTSSVILHFIGATLVLGRLLHAYGVSQSTEPLPVRVSGMMATFAALLGAAGACLIGALRQGIF
ncbi:MAG TPA: MAPEG family protein [Hyphomicrobiaceae bacterium]|nr:MAPEG family protein [Hyphomicrobiaceae bacterium]